MSWLSGFIWRCIERKIYISRMFVQLSTFISAACISACAVAIQPFVLGVLENTQCKVPARTAIRPLFVLADGKWTAFTQQQRVQQLLFSRWRILDEKNETSEIRTLISADTFESDWAFARDHSLSIDTNQIIPTTRNSQRRFAGWCDAPARAPLVATTSLSIIRSTVWRESTTIPKISRSISTAFERSLHGRQLCTGSDKPKLYRFKQSDLQQVRQFRHIGGAGLISVRLRDDVFECRSELGAVIGVHWFYVNPTPAFIGRDIDLVDIVEVDGNVGPTFVFWHSGYNRDGYVLFNSLLKPVARFIWSYH